MAIGPGDILLKYSTGSTTGPGNNIFSSGQNSLGGFISQTQISGTGNTGGTTTQSIFQNISGTQNAQVPPYTDYSCVFVHNSNTLNTLLQAVVYLVPSGYNATTIAIGVDNYGSINGSGGSQSQLNSYTQQAFQVPNNLTAPPSGTDGVGFSSPVTHDGGITLGDIGPGYCRAFWIRRTANNSGPADGDGMTLRIEGDTGA